MKDRTMDRVALFYSQPSRMSPYPTYGKTQIKKRGGYDAPVLEQQKGGSKRDIVANELERAINQNKSTGFENFLQKVNAAVGLGRYLAKGVFNPEVQLARKKRWEKLGLLKKK